MKLLGLILIILAAAAVIAGITLAIVQLVNADQPGAAVYPRGRQGNPLGDRDRLRDRDATGSLFGQEPSEGPGQGRLDRHGAGLPSSSLAGIARNLLIISAIVLIYWLGGKLYRRLRPKAPPPG